MQALVRRVLLIFFLLLTPRVVVVVVFVVAQAQPGDEIITVRYGYFTETRPIHAACARQWFDLRLPGSNYYYRVECYPQPSGNFAASRLDNQDLDLANLGSTPLAQGTIIIILILRERERHDVLFVSKTLCGVFAKVVLCERYDCTIKVSSCLALPNIYLMILLVFLFFINS